MLDEMYKNFRPNLTPAQVIAMGSFGGCYFHPRGGKPGILSPKKGVAVSHLEFPVTVRGHHESARVVQLREISLYRFAMRSRRVCMYI